jgi:predicted kinase
MGREQGKTSILLRQVDFHFEFSPSGAIFLSMENRKLYIIMVGLPARGKSTIASRLKDNLLKDSVATRVFNNGDLRRRMTGKDTSSPKFYDPTNAEGAALRERISSINLNRARGFLHQEGQVAILDATNVSLKRREAMTEMLNDHPILFIECVNDDESILHASILRKIGLPEFNHLERNEALESFRTRIEFYNMTYTPLKGERNFVRLDSLNNRILKEELGDSIPHYDRIRDCLVTDSVKNLFLLRHGETFFNLENRIGGDSGLTENGWTQARAMAHYFKDKSVPVIFTSRKHRTVETAQPIKEMQKGSTIISLEEFNEIDSGICECMSYQEIRENMPNIHEARRRDKYNYIYPGGEGYVSMRERIYRGSRRPSTSAAKQTTS